MIKKRIISCIISAAMLICMTATMPFSASAEIVEIFKDDFENGFGGWAGRGDASISVVDAAANTGSKSLYVSERTIAWHGAACAKIKELRPGKNYYISGYVMQDEGNDTEQINLQILYKDSSGKEQYKSIANTQAKKGEWAKVGGNYTIPDDASNVTIYFETPSNLINFYIDDISATGEPNDDGETAEGFTENFESGINGWSGRGDAVCEIVSGVGCEGSSALFTSGRKSLWNGPSENKTMVLSAKGYYKFTGWVMYNGDEWSETQTFSMNIQFQQEGKEQYIEIGRVTASKGEWAKIEAKYTIPADAANFVIYFQTAWKNDASVTDQDLMDFYIDNVSAEPLPEPQAQMDIPSLKDVYSDYFILGGSCSKGDMEVQAAKDIIVKHYDSITFGNTLKPDSTLDQSASKKYAAEHNDDTNPQVNIDAARKQLDFVKENNIKVRGHVLVWHSQTPDWFFKENFNDDGAWVSKEVMIKRLENYVKNLMQTLKDEYPEVEFYAWDVVNEAFSEQGTMREAGSNNIVSGQSAWVKVFGDDSFINYAFKFARKYAPEGCKLFYNDYNEYTPAKRDGIIKKIKELVKEGNIDGIGMQSHIGMSYPSIELYEEAFRKYDELGLEIHITELDIDQKSNSQENMLDLAQRYQDVFNLFKKLVNKGVNLTAVITWGISDSSSWIGGYPNLFDTDYQAKDAFYAVADTDKEIQKIKTSSSLEYNGTDSDYEKAFRLQKKNEIVNAASFRTIWSGNTVIFRLESAVTGNARIVFEGKTDETLISKSVHLKAGETKDIEIDLSELSIKSGASAGMEIIIEEETDKSGVYNYYAWNTNEIQGAEDIEYTFGKLNFIGQPLSAAAYKISEAPVIDGNIDDCWRQAEAVDVNKYTMGKDGAYGTAKALWDKDYIYFMIEVKDKNLSKANASAYEQDTVEIFFDENNGKTSYYEEDDIQIRVNYDNEVTVTDGKSPDIYKTAAKITDGGYIVEIAIPHTIKEFEANQVVGYDVQINDDNGEGKRTGIANWSDLTGQGYINTSGFGVLELKNDPSEFEIGDINSDGQVNAADLVMLQKYLVQSVRYIENADAADINSDNVLNVFDASLLRGIILK